MICQLDFLHILIGLMLQVSFLGSFAGCVDHNNMPVLWKDDKSENAGWRRLFKSRTGSVRARIVMVDYPNKVDGTTVHAMALGPDLKGGCKICACFFREA